MKLRSNVSRIAVAMSIGLVTPSSLLAQDTSHASSTSSGGLDDIVVTARKRDETSISVPVTVTAVNAAELSRRSITNLDGIARIVPQLIISYNQSSIQGGDVVLRGIAGPNTNPFGDQAVSFNIDGVQIAKASVRRMSDTDLQQIEVLKGPQALFYGKNSPGGVVSIRTADPTDHFEAKASAGYEFQAREIRTEGYVSGPLTETLGLRLAGSFSDMKGYLENETPSGVYLADKNSRLPKSRDYTARATLKWEPSDSFNARFKFNIGRSVYAGGSQDTQYIFCPFGSPQSGAIDDCKADKHIVHASSGAVSVPLDPRFRDGFGYGHQRQILTSLELNFKPSDEITLTSITGLYDVRMGQADNYVDYALALPSLNLYRDREFSQELRAQSNFDSPVNFTAGLFYADTNATVGSHTYIYPAEASALPILAANGLGFIPLRTPFQILNYLVNQRGTAYSAFLQTSYKPVEQVEITVGGRYSYEKKRIPLAFDGGFVSPVLTDANRVVPLVSKASWNDFSPEATIAYRPSTDLTFFANYKHGFLSGGFNASAISAISGTDISYNPQTIKGFEGGIKAALFDRRLRVNLAAYTYKLSSVQVVSFTNVTNTIRNAAAARVSGAEFDFNLKTPIEGLNVHGAAAYNKAHYISFDNAPCYNGQRIVDGCSIGGNGVPVQDLSGGELPRAPRWNLSGGFNFDKPLSGGLKLGLSSDVTYSSSYLTDATNAPTSRMPRYALVDASLRLSSDSGWELALLGRNLTDQYYWTQSPDAPFTGSGTGTAAGVLADRFASTSRGREIRIRATYAFGK